VRAGLLGGDRRADLVGDHGVLDRGEQVVGLSQLQADGRRQGVAVQAEHVAHHGRGFRGSRYISAAVSARGEWAPGGSSKSGFDAYATAKQGNLATVFAFARETPRLRFSAVEPGFNPG